MGKTLEILLLAMEVIASFEAMPGERENEQSFARKPPAKPEEHLNSSGLDSTRCMFSGFDWEEGEER